jgi:hypothetical protein
LNLEEREEEKQVKYAYLLCIMFPLCCLFICHSPTKD